MGTHSSLEGVNLHASLWDETCASKHLERGSLPPLQERGRGIGQLVTRGRGREVSRSWR